MRIIKYKVVIEIVTKIIGIFVDSENRNIEKIPVKEIDVISAVTILILKFLFQQ